MKILRSFALLSCLVLATAGCKKKDPDAAGSAAGSAMAGKATGSAATGSAATGSAATGSAATGSAATGSAATGSAGAAATDDLKIPASQPKVGDKTTETIEESAAMKIEFAPGKLVDSEQRKHEVRVTETVAIDGGMVTKAKVSYPEFVESTTTAGKVKDKPSPVVGKAYLLWREGTELKVTLEDGSAPSPAELKVVRKTGKNVGHLDPMDQIIASKTWKPGVKVEFTADELAQLNAVRGDADSAPTTTSVALTLASADAAVATFEIAMSMMMKGDQGDKGEMKIDLAGTVKVDRATGRPLEMAAGGPLAGNMGVPVTGTMTGKSTYTY